MAKRTKLVDETKITQCDLEAIFDGSAIYNMKLVEYLRASGQIYDPTARRRPCCTRVRIPQALLTLTSA